MRFFIGKLKRLISREREAGSRPVSETEYLHDSILTSHKTGVGFHHPNDQLWFRGQCLAVCRKRLSTGTVVLLEALQSESDDPISRKMLARKSYTLRKEYLASFKEYSDRALILRCERGNLFDQWEGIFILGSFGGTEGTKYLRSRLNSEQNEVLRQVISRSIERIQENRERKKKTRGF